MPVVYFVVGYSLVFVRSRVHVNGTRSLVGFFLLCHLFAVVGVGLRFSLLLLLLLSHRPFAHDRNLGATVRMIENTP